MTQNEFIEKNGVNFRFKSWALIPTKDCWSNWTSCSKTTMMEFLRVLNRIDEQSTARLSPKYAEQYRACEEIQCIVNSTDECWTWRPEEGWYRTPPEPMPFNIPSGKGQRPPRRSKQEQAEYQAATDDEIFGTADDAIE